MSTFSIKIIALILMTLDHIGHFIPNMPIWLRWVGRSSVPLFIFCSVWGLHYTKNKNTYLLRLYICSILMEIMNCFVIFCSEPGTQITNNIFTTLLMITILILLIESKKKMYLLIFIAIQLIGIGLRIFLYGILNMNYLAFRIMNTIICNISSVEGGLFIVLLGVVLYFTKEDRMKLATSFILISSFDMWFFCTSIPERLVSKVSIVFDNYFLGDLVIFTFDMFGINAIGATAYKSIFYSSYQWMMIGALPFMLCYNNKKGKGWKYFFYLYYPLHIYILFYFGQSLNN